MSAEHLVDQPTAIIVFPHSTRRGNTPTPRQIARLLKAAEIYHQTPKSVIIAPGACGRRADSTTPISQISKDVLIAFNVDPNRISTEAQSTNTFENLLKAKTLIDQLNLPLRHLILVSSFPHLLRAHFLSKQVFDPRDYQITPVISDLFTTFLRTGWDGFWEMSAWLKIVRNLLKNPQYYRSQVAPYPSVDFPPNQTIIREI